MLDLPQVTLICLTNKDFEGHKRALDKSCEGITWGAVKMIQAVGIHSPWHIYEDTGKPWLSREEALTVKEHQNFDIYRSSIEINNIDDWNKAIIYELHNYVQTDFAMLVHADGYVVAPQNWREEFLGYDFIGAPWPLPTDGYSYRTPKGEVVRVGNSVSIRSKRLLQLPSELGLEWRSYYGNTNEDGFICVHNRNVLMESGIRFAPIETARYFSKEHEIEENKGIETFAFHQVDI